MKIMPSISKSGPLYPTLLAMAGAVFTGCDKQKVPGIVPYGVPASEPAPDVTLAEAPAETPIKPGGDILHTPDEE